MAGTPPSNKGGPEKMQKGGPGKFWFVKGIAEGFFSCLAGGQGVLGPFLMEAVPPLPAMKQNLKKS